ncbi:MAG: hypothetical protein FJ098_09805 [Deltaproteobacteria bacterium]|nr:hypothetical protein [Deltaproteobacteria bacterium]
MSPRTGRLLAAAVAVTGCTVACGDPGTPGAAGWVVPDTMPPWPDGLAGDDGRGPVDVRTAQDVAADASCEDGGACRDAGCGDAGPCPDGTGPETGPFCWPGERSCDGLVVLECDGDGAALVAVEDCDDGNSCTGDECLAGECLHEPEAACCDPPCPMGRLCWNGECVCAPQCLAKQCGDDGCGGVCGECPAQHHCTPAGLCVCDPDCEGRTCGPDGCGASCGECPGSQDLCLDGQCVCQPACTGKQCGADGCGAACGECPTGHVCTAEGLCSCVPACAGKQCGPDSCGGSCGACDGPLYTCSPGGSCVHDTSVAPFLDVCVPQLVGSRVYYLCKTGKDWGDARDYCEDRATWLVTITSQGEQDTVAGLAAGSGQFLWIGLRQGFFEWDPWGWLTGEPLGQTWWGAEQPDDGGFWGDEDCGEMAPWGTWNDNECGADRWFCCEYAL